MNRQQALQGTFVLIAVNVIVFLVVVSQGGGAGAVINNGAMFTPFIDAGQYWRFFTAQFLHSDVTHLGMNLLTLYVAGTMLEPIFRSNRFALLYLAGGVMGNVFSYTFNSPLTISLGASTATYGLLGAVVMLGYLFPHHRGIKAQSQQVFTTIMLNLAFSLLPGVDLFGHIGGLIGGIIVAYAMGSQQFYGKRPVLMTALYLVILVGVFLLGRTGIV